MDITANNQESDIQRVLTSAINDIMESIGTEALTSSSVSSPSTSEEDASEPRANVTLFNIVHSSDAELYNYEFMLKYDMFAPDALLNVLPTLYKVKLEYIIYQAIVKHIPYHKQYLHDGRHVLVAKPLLTVMAVAGGCRLTDIMQRSDDTICIQNSLASNEDVLRALNISSDSNGISDFTADFLCANLQVSTMMTPADIANYLRLVILNDEYNKKDVLDNLVVVLSASAYNIPDLLPSTVSLENQRGVSRLRRRWNKLNNVWPEYATKVYSPFVRELVQNYMIRDEQPVCDELLKFIKDYLPDLEPKCRWTHLVTGLKRRPLKAQAYLLGLPYHKPNEKLIKEKLQKLNEIGEDEYLKEIARINSTIVGQIGQAGEQLIPFNSVRPVNFGNDEDLAFVPLDDTNPNDIVANNIGGTIYRYTVRDYRHFAESTECPYTRSKIKADIIDKLTCKTGHAAHEGIPFNESLSTTWDKIRQQEEKRIEEYDRNYRASLDAIANYNIPDTVVSDKVTPESATQPILPVTAPGSVTVVAPAPIVGYSGCPPLPMILYQNMPPVSQSRLPSLSGMSAGVNVGLNNLMSGWKSINSSTFSANSAGNSSANSSNSSSNRSNLEGSSDDEDN